MKTQAEIDLEENEILELVWDALNEREKYHAEYYYGLNGRPKLSCAKIAKLMSISTARSAQIKNKAIWKMRRRLVSANRLSLTSLSEKARMFKLI